MNSKNSFSEKTHEATRKKTIRKEEKYSRNSKTVFSSRQFHWDFREYCAMSRKCQFDFLSTKANFINRRFWAIDETRHRWECLWCLDSFFQMFSLRHHDRFSLFVAVLSTVTVWIQIYTYRSADWSMILQSSLLFFYITSIFKWFEFHQVILWSHLLSSWSYSLINLALIDRFSQFSWKSRYLRNLRTSYSRIVNDSLNLIRRIRQVALWH